MCGIVGFCAPSLNHEIRAEVLTDLLLASKTRGSDAAGIAFITAEGTNLLKAPGDPGEFVKSDEYKALTQNLPAVVLGHTRAASGKGSARGINNTTGKKLSDPKDNENNHPFHSKQAGITLVHNGFIDREFWEDAYKTERSGIVNPFESTTDSEAALRVLESLYLTDGKVLSFLDCIDNMALNVAGSYAFGILKADEPNKIWFAVKDKPLVVAWVPQYEALLFASTEEILKNTIADYEVEVLFNFILNEKDTSPEMVSEQMAKNTAIEVIVEPDAEDPLDMFNIETRKLTPTNNDYEFHRKIYEEQQKKESKTDDTKKTEVESLFAN